MKDSRLIGFTIKKEAEKHMLTAEQLGEHIGMSSFEIEQVYRGRLLCTFPQLSALADLFQVAVGSLIDGDEAYYDEYVVSCMKQFHNAKNREMVLDLIYDYLDILDEVG